MKNKFTTAAFLILLPFLVSAQTNNQIIDSLFVELEQETIDTNKVHLLYFISYHYRPISLDEAENYSEKALEISKKSGFKRGEVKSLFSLAVVNRRKGETEKAIQLGKQSLELAEKEKDWVFAGHNCNSLGNAYSNSVGFDSAMIYYFKAIEHYEKAGRTSNMASVYNNIGDTFWNQDKDDLAEEYFQKALKIYQENNELRYAAMILNNLGKIQPNYEAAKMYFDRALEISQENNDLTTLAATYNGIGAKLIGSEDWEKAKEYYQKALDLNIQVGNRRRMATAYNSLGKIYFNLNQPEKAIEHYEKALELSTQSRYVRRRKGITENLAQLYFERGDSKKAYEYLEISKALGDTMYNEKNLEFTSELEAKYNRKEKEAELANQQLVIEQQKNSRNRILIGSALALLVLTFIFQRYYYHQKRKKQEAILALEREKVESENLRGLDNMKTKFFSNISHELRTPLTMIISPIEEAIQKTKDKSTKNELTLAHSNSKKLLNLVNEILDLSKLEAGKLELNERAVNLCQLTKRIFYSFQSLAHLRNVKLDFQYDLPEDLGVELDVEKFEKILNNLLSNAIKFNKSVGSVQLAVGSQNGNLTFRVKDSGHGISEEDLSNVFDRFYQSKSGKMTGGTGIGLALSKELAQLFGGDLTVESKIGKGSIFTLTIPLKEAKNIPQIIENESIIENEIIEPKLDFEPQNGYQPILLNGKKPRILVVEDNLEMSNFLTRILTPYYACKTAFNGKEALRKLEKESFDLITSDVMMPEMDGFEFREAVNKHSNWRQTPFIMLTARALESDKLQGFNLGVDDYITKPFSSKELLARIDNLLKNKSERDTFQSENPSEKNQLEQPESAETELLKQAEKIVFENLDDPTFKVTDLAKKIGYSQRQLARIIRKLTGLSSVNFILEIRLQKAYQLLQSRQFMTVSEVRYEIGIESAAYFTTKFKARFGKNPKEFLEV